MNAEKHNLDRIYFGGCFIRGHSATISTLSYAIRFWSGGKKKALFLRHEGYLGAIGTPYFSAMLLVSMKGSDACDPQIPCFSYRRRLAEKY